MPTNTLRAAREAALMSQTSLARQSGLSAHTIVNLERGYTRATMDTRERILTVLGISKRRHLEIFGPLPTLGRPGKGELTG